MSVFFNLRDIILLTILATIKHITQYTCKDKKYIPSTQRNRQEKERGKKYKKGFFQTGQNQPPSI